MANAINARPYAIYPLELGPMENFVYLIHDHATDRAAVVDPAWNVPEVLKLAQGLGARITDILLTHSHHDHINGISEVLDAADAQIHLMKAEAQFWGRELEKPMLHHGSDRLALGETEIELLHTPGHTPGSACYRVGGNLLTGDTLFVFGCGRCDLKGGDPETMFTTLRKLKEDLPRDTLVHPGHNYAVKETSTMEEQVAGNPFLHFHSCEAFVNYRMVEHSRVRSTPYGPETPPEVAQ
jgi:glyoxylase-like metal-dependent hydrolase (beta-lactamase superfamily II)